jgi:UDP-N-acetylmuramoylalanine--D-glutamate ligase
MDRYAGLEDYVAAKARIYRGAEIGVVNRDDPRVCALSGMASRDLGFTLGEPDGEDFGIRAHRGEPWLYQGKSPLFPAAEMPLPGRHNLSNALSALALGQALGLPIAAMREALREFAGLPHRTQLVAATGGVRWFNDSKGTNVGACIAALEGLYDPTAKGRAVLIAGGDCKGADFAQLVPVVVRVARAVVLMGQDAPRLGEALEGRLSLLHAGSMEQAVQLAAQVARPGDHVLLSPACASFDMFRNFEHRGEAFVAAVKELAV